MTSDFTIAVHALVFLHCKQETVSSEMLAKNICTNPARVRKVMSKLKKAALVSTKEGAVGGYLMEKKAEEITLAEIAKALEASFVCTGWQSGDAAHACRVAAGMAEAMDNLYRELNELCLCRLAQTTLAEVASRVCCPKTQQACLAGHGA
ncbi:MAG: RrF2 family transcriptional regulator [Christensenellales bacterium]